MFIGVDTLIEIKEGIVNFDEWKPLVGIRQSDGAGLQIQSTGMAVDIILEASTFKVDYEEGRGKVRLIRTFYSTDGMRELAKILMDESDKIDSIRAGNR